MKPLSAVIAAAMIVVALPAFAAGQPFLYNTGSLNGNICRSQGRDCHIPQPLNPAPLSHPLVMSRPPAITPTPLVPPSEGLFSRIYSGFVSLF